MSKGWLRVTGEGVRNADNLDFWLSAALDYNARETKGAAP